MKKDSSKPNRWMPLYVGDYLTATTHLDTEEHGAYLLLLMAYWNQLGPLPDNDASLAAIAKLSVHKWKQIKTTIRGFFTIGADGRLHQHRIDEEIDKALGISANRAVAGRTGAAKSLETRQANASKKSEQAGRQNATPLPLPLQKEDNQPPESGSGGGVGKVSPKPKPTPPEIILQKGCEILGIRLEADTNRHSWPGEIVRLQQYGCTDEEVLQGFRVAKDNGRDSMGYVAAVARRIHDEDAAPRTPKPRRDGGPQIAVAGGDQDRALVKLYREKGIWPSPEGPKPDEPDCLKDPALLAEFGYGPLAKAKVTA